MRRSRIVAAATAFTVVFGTLAFAGVAATTSAANAADINGAWTTVTGGSPLNNKVYALLQSGTKIYVGGMFTNAGDAADPASYLASFDTTTPSNEPLKVTTSTLAAGNSYTYVSGMALSGTDLYFGGRFGNATLNNIAKVGTNTGTVSALGTGSSGGEVDVEELAVIGGDVYAGGGFNSLGGVPNTEGVAKWNGSSWSALDSGLDGAQDIVNGMTVVGTDLYLGGQFDGGDDAGTITTSKRLIKWTGTSWAAVGDGINQNLVAAVSNNTVAGQAATGLYVGGNFTGAGGTPTTLNGLARLDVAAAAWEGVGTSPVGVSGGNGVIESMAFDSTGNLYIGGSFTSVGGVSANNIAKWDGTSWSSISCGANNGVNNVVRAILPQTDGTLIIGGFFTNAGGLANNDYLVKYTPGADNCPAPRSEGGGAGTPSAPLNVKAKVNTLNGSVTVSWDAPASNGGSAIIGYTAATADDQMDCWTTLNSCTFRVDQVPNFAKPFSQAAYEKSLPSEWLQVNSQVSKAQYLFMSRSGGATALVPWAYGFYVQALNAVGWGARGFAPQVDPWAPIKPPSAPQSVVAKAGWNSVEVSWLPPLDGGDAMVTNYLVQAEPGRSVCITRLTDASLTSCTFRSLNPGTKYTFTVQGLNQGGWGDRSVKTTLPVAPYNLKVTGHSREKQGIFQLFSSLVKANGKAPGYAPGTKINVWYKVGDNGNWIQQKDPKVTVGKDSTFKWQRFFDRKHNGAPVSVRFSIKPSATSGAAAVNPVTAGDADVSGWSNWVRLTPVR